MPLFISDADLNEAGLNERDARIEFACRMFEGGKLALWPAAKLAGLDRVEMEHELVTRGIALYCPSLDEVVDDLARLDRLGI